MTLAMMTGATLQAGFLHALILDREHDAELLIGLATKLDVLSAQWT